MPEKKKQHTVPKFYLKFFSNKKDNKTIGIFNIKSERFIRNGSLESQACKDYFYGKDKKIEDALQVIESEASRIFTSLIRDFRLPDKGTSDYFTLIVHTVYQASRTEYTSDAINEHFDKLIKTAYKEDKRVKNYLPMVKFRLKNPAAFSLGIISEFLPLVFDLEYKLLINKTGCKFITSDNPAVKYNQFMEKRKWPGGHCGWQSIGFQLFMPLCPDVCLILYDKDIYDVGSKSRNTLSIWNINDVKEINRLQFLNANENVYFNEEVHESYVRQIYQSDKKYRREQKVIVDEFHQTKPEYPEEASLFHSHYVDLEINFFLTFIKESKKAKRQRLGHTMMNVRKPQLCRKFSEMVQKQRSIYEKSTEEKGFNP